MPRSESLLAAAAPRSHQLPDPAFLDDANLAACHVAMLEERDRQAKLAEVATLHLRQARRELCRLRDALDRERRRWSWRWRPLPVGSGSAWRLGRTARSRPASWARA
jgi:hypothetical protein